MQPDVGQGPSTVSAVDADAVLADLDADQRAAVTSDSRLVAVIAGAGSGKTRVLTRRIAHRIATESADARHTLALTFTREAAGEIRRRLFRLGLRERVEAGTFHSVMLGVLTQRWADTDRRPLTVVSDRWRLVGDALSAGSTDVDRRQLAAFVAEIDWAAARGIAPEAYAAACRRQQRRPGPGVDRCAAVYADYAQLKRRRGVIDFDDVLSHAIRDMQRDGDFADSVRWRFRHVLVDEAQDLNPLQHQLVDLLRQGRDDLFLVGDPAQAIYGFNGADPSLLVEVETRFPGVEVVRLPVNHRCTPQIVRAGVHVLDATGQPGALVSFRGDGPAVERLEAIDEADEADRIARFVVGLDPNLVRSGNVAILARTNQQLAAFETALQSAGVPTRRSATAAGSPLQAVVRSAATRGSASQLRGWAHDILDAPPPAPGTRPAATSRGNDDTPDPERRVAAAVLDYLREQPLGDGAGFRGWVATTNPFRDASTDGVDLLSFHAAKGREWHTVIVSGVETSLVPHKSATTAEARAEEGRLLYVALTRATDRLLITHASRRHGYARAASPFLEGLQLDEPVAAPPPRRRRAATDPVGDRLRAWRDDAARRAGILPEQLCSGRDLDAIARARPTTADELAEVTSFGSITAHRLAPDILAVLDGRDGTENSAGAAGQSARSTITGA